MNYQDQISKLEGLQETVSRLLSIAHNTSMDTHAERTLFLNLDLAIDETLDAMYNQVQAMTDAGIMNVFQFEEWDEIIATLRQQN